MITPPPLSSLVLFLLSLIYFLFSTSSTFSWGLVCWYMDTSLVTKLLKISLPPHHSLNAYKFLGMHEAPWSPNRSITECFLVQSCISNHSCCEFRDTIATSCPKVSVPFHTLTLALKFFLSLLLCCSWALDGWYSCCVYGWAFKSHLFSVLWTLNETLKSHLTKA